MSFRPINLEQAVKTPESSTIQTTGGFRSLSGEALPATPTLGVEEKKGLFDYLTQGVESVSGFEKGIVKGAVSNLFDIPRLGQNIMAGGVKFLTGVEIPESAKIQKPEFLTPQGTAEKIGYGTEKLGEFFLPGFAFAKIAKLTGGMGIARRVGLPALTEAIGAGTVSSAQTQNISTGAKVGLLSGGIAGGLGVMGELAMLYKGAGLSTGLIEKTLGINKKLIEKGKSPAERFLKEGSGFTKAGIVKNSQKVINQTKSEISNIVNPMKQTAGSAGVIQDIRQGLKQFYGDSLNETEITQIIDNLPLALLRENTDVAIKKLDDLRSIIGSKYLGNGRWLNNATSEKISALKIAYASMAKFIKAQDERLPALFAREADFIKLATSARSELAKPHALTNILELLGSSIYGFSSGESIGEKVKNAAISYALLRGLISTPAAITTARTLRIAPKIGIPTLKAGLEKQISEYYR